MVMDAYDLRAPSTFRYTLRVPVRDTDERVADLLDTFMEQIATEPFLGKNESRDIQHIRKEMLERIDLCKKAQAVLDPRIFHGVCSRVLLGRDPCHDRQLESSPQRDVWVEIVLVDTYNYHPIAIV